MKKSLKKNKSNQRLYFLAVLATVIFIFLNVFQVYQTSRNREKAISNANTFLDLIDRLDHQGAYDSWLGSTYTKHMALNDFDLNMTLAHDLLGTNLKREISEIKVETNVFKNTSFVEIKYNSEFAFDNKARESLVLSGSADHNNLKIQSYIVHSDLMIKY